MKKRFFIGFVLLFVLLSALGLLLCSGRLWFNSPSLTEYPVRGIDVSHYQGTIDWQQIARQDIRFAFIKATEGSSYQDSLFSENWSAAMQTDIRIGAYHFFSYDSPGLFQAKNFIQTVPKTDHMLPPVIDLEFYGKYRSEPLPKADVCAILDSLLAALEQHYQMKPIL